MSSNTDSDGEEFDCDMRKIPPEHLPMFKRLASVNGRINRMKRRQLVDVMNRKKLSVDGEMEVLKKRLKNHYRMQALIKAKICESDKTYFPYFVVIDIEATCTENNPSDYKYVIFKLFSFECTRLYGLELLGTYLIILFFCRVFFLGLLKKI